MGAKGSKFANCRAAKDHVVVVPHSEPPLQPSSAEAANKSTLKEQQPPRSRPGMNPRSESLELSYLPQVHREDAPRDSWGTLSVGESLGFSDSIAMMDGSSFSYSSSNLSSISSCQEHSSQTSRTVPLSEEEDSQGVVVKGDCKRQRHGDAVASMKEEQRRHRKLRILQSRMKLQSEEQSCNAISTPDEKPQKTQQSRRKHTSEKQSSKAASTPATHKKPKQKQQQRRQPKMCRNDPPGALQRFASTRATAQT